MTLQDKKRRKSFWPFLFEGGGLLRDLFLPPRCLTCQKRVLEAGCLCAACWREVHFIDHPLCPITGVPFSRPWPPDMPSAQSRLFPPNYDKARTLMSYDSQTARALITRMKYRDSPEIAAYAARWFMRLARPLLESADALIPVPLHRRRLFGRRFNQSAEIARALSRQSGVRYLPDLLLRSRNTRPQTGLRRAQRRRNVAGVFHCSPEQKGAIEDRSVILVDDVMTSGATSRQCVAALRRAGAKHVSVLTLARVVHESETHP